MCTMPDPCLAQPCSIYSECVRSTIDPDLYSCVCVGDATGTPGPNGEGCLLPTVDVANGTISFQVSDVNDIVIQIGLATYSPADFDARLNTITDVGGILDTEVSHASASLYDESRELSAEVWLKWSVSKC